MGEFPAASYDAWKTRSPDDEADRWRRPPCLSGNPYVCDYPRCECQRLSEMNCTACEDVGWLDDNGHIIACSECSTECEMDESDGS